MNLERMGVLGTEFSFSNTEKERAQAMRMTYTTNNYGTLIGNVGESNTIGNVSIGSLDVHEARTLAAQIERHRDELVEGGADVHALDQNLEIINSELATASPNAQKLKSAFADVRNAISGAAGSVIAIGVTFGIAKLFGF